MNKNLKIVYGYPYYPSQAYDDTQQMALRYVKRLREDGYNIIPFCLTLNYPNSCLSFAELDLRWQIGDRALLKMYEQLETVINQESADVFINSAGINMHPEFISKLPVFTVFQCFDDPENSHNLSKPVAYAYDLALVGNIAEVETYKSWGVKNAEWIPLGLQPNIYDKMLTYEHILNGERDIDLFMMLDRLAPWRKTRVDKLAVAFPNANFYGRGWKRGYLSNEQQLSFLKRAKIGPNIHNSTGPINFRTFYLPANGVMQICDNKSHLAKIYELGKEVVGFDSVEECIELCHYYLEHDEERRYIAANGWKRVMTDYTEKEVFARTVRLIEKYISETGKNLTFDSSIAHIYRKKTTSLCWKRVFWKFKKKYSRILRTQGVMKKIYQVCGKDN